MEKKDIIEFFDRLAPQWDADLIRDDRIIAAILDGAGVCPGADVLDVACGTGVLIGDYLARGVNSVTAVDISPEMVRIAKSKFRQDHVTILCADVLELPADRRFDCVVVYNAFPHFPEPEKLIRVLSSFLKPGGTLTVAHGMSRAQIDARHHGAASKVSVGLMHEDDLARLMSACLNITVKRSDEHMYQVTGKLVC